MDRANSLSDLLEEVPLVVSRPVLVVTLLTSSLAPAADGALPAEACPEVFGTTQVHESNEADRQRKLDELDQAAHTIDLVHTGAWEEPERIRYRGLELVGTRLNEDEEPVALVRVDPEEGELECRPGLYRLEVDDSIGADAAVLAVLDDVLLVEADGDLRFLKTEQAEQPVFRMIWRSEWKLLRLPGERISTRRARRSPRHRRRRRRKL